MMAEKGILFNGDMMRAIRADAKTQTRRPFSKQPIGFRDDWAHDVDPGDVFVDVIGQVWQAFQSRGRQKAAAGILGKRLVKPPYAVGDILYCRETWCLGRGNWPGYRKHEGPTTKGPGGIIQPVLYRANEYGNDADHKWRPSIHMPKWAAREWLKVTAVRAERVQDISRKDVWAEGINQDEYETWLDDVQNIGVPAGTTYEQPKDLFQREWDAIYYRKDGLKWDLNPWAWVTEFERKDDGEAKASS